MVASKLKGIWLSNGYLITKILEYIDFLEGKYFEEDVTKIVEVALGIMMYKIIIGNIV